MWEYAILNGVWTSNDKWNIHRPGPCRIVLRERFDSMFATILTVVPKDPSIRRSSASFETMHGRRLSRNGTNSCGMRSARSSPRDFRNQSERAWHLALELMSALESVKGSHTEFPWSKVSFGDSM